MTVFLQIFFCATLIGIAACARLDYLPPGRPNGAGGTGGYPGAVAPGAGSGGPKFGGGGFTAGPSGGGGFAGGSTGVGSGGYAGRGGYSGKVIKDYNKPFNLTQNTPNRLCLTPFLCPLALQIIFKNEMKL